MTDAPNSAAAPQGDIDRITRFFDAIRSAGIIRQQDRWIAGVCSGLGTRIGIAPAVVRLLAVILVLLGAPAVFAYAIGWAILPDSSGRIHAEEAVRGHFEPVMIVIGLLLVATFVPFTPTYWWNAGAASPALPVWLQTTFAVVWSVLIIGGIVWVVVYLSQKQRASGTASLAGAPPKSASTDHRDAVAPVSPNRWQDTVDQDRARQEQNRLRQERYRVQQDRRVAARRARRPGAGFTAIVLGIALMSSALAALVFSAGVWSQEAFVVQFAVALGMIALGMIVAGFRGLESGALGGFAFLAVLALLVSGILPAGTQFVLIGSPTWTVAAPTETVENSGYAIVIGQATLDLSGLDEGRTMFMRPDNTTQSIEVWAAVGQTRIVLPEFAPVLIDANAFVGAVDYSGSPSDPDKQGILLHDARLFNSNTGRAATVVHVRSFVGQVSIIGPISTGKDLP